MRRTIACAAVILGTAALPAQPPDLPGPAKGPFSSGTSNNDYKMLLVMKGVQKDLDLTAEQAKAVGDLGTDIAKRSREATKELDKTIPNVKDRIARRAEIREKLEKEYFEGLAKHLNPGQLKRLGQIRLQADAPGSLGWPAVDAKLKLTADQKAALEKTNRFLNADRLNVMTKELPDVGADAAKRAAFDQKLRDLTAKYTAEALNLLDDTQKKGWKELTGDPFDLSKIGFGSLGKD